MTALAYDEEPKAFPAPPRPRLIASRPDPMGNVPIILADIMEPGRGRVEIADVFAAYSEPAKRGQAADPGERVSGQLAALSSSSASKSKAARAAVSAQGQK